MSALLGGVLSSVARIGKSRIWISLANIRSAVGESKRTLVLETLPKLGSGCDELKLFLEAATDMLRSV